jgi:UDP-N-acetylmuramoylalanine--D-glutamate ligase
LRKGETHPASGIKQPASSNQQPASGIKFRVPDSLRGKHNLENLSAACLASLAAGGTPAGIQAALDNFRGLPHRIEYVDTVNKVRYFDDSKATNPDAVAKALENFDGARIILIMGGRNKGYDFSMLKESMHRYAKQLIVIGEATEEIIAALKDAAPTAPASTMEDAVLQAHHAAQPGDVVLLSPACSSFDMYRNYAERGEAFCRAVRELKNESC